MTVFYGLLLLIAAGGAAIWLAIRLGKQEAQTSQQAQVAHDIQEQNDKERKLYADRPATRDELFKRMRDASKH